jgi:hypothetical protein
MTEPQPDCDPLIRKLLHNTRDSYRLDYTFHQYVEEEKGGRLTVVGRCQSVPSASKVSFWNECGGGERTRLLA